MESLDKLIKEREELTKALKNGDITTNEYQSFYYSYSQRIKKLNQTQQKL